MTLFFRLAAGASIVAGLFAAPAAQAVVNCDQWGTVDVAGGTYYVQNNFYNKAGSGTQCIDVDANTGAFTVTGNNWVATNGAPGGYPSIVKGCHWGKCTKNSGLPIRLSDLSSNPTNWNTTPAGNGNWNVSYDIWFNQAPSTAGQPDGTEIMIWINHSGSVTPAGSKTGNVTINGINFDVWTAPKGSAGFNTIWHIVSYVATSTRTSVNFDLKPFYNDAVSRGLLNNAWYLIDIEAGFEGWQSWSGARSNSFSTSFNTGGGGGGGGGGAFPVDTNAWYQIVNQGNNLCVDDAEYGTANGAKVQQWSCNTNGQANQEWQFQPTDSGYYKLASRQAPIVIDVAGQGTAGGTPLILWSYWGGANQQWKPVDMGGGFFKLVSRATGRCLDVPGATNQNGRQLQIWDCNNLAPQNFRLIRR
ncbi:RICIN domain-containing protein [Niveibacterium sp. SC-1]|uniref:RICIN domain-containing protein n=1 Tax=Niveibacterium sp. SC-1 TaxID=3135646 RepID=UPI00311FA8B3